jgi:glyoxylate/hydroxypyruvate reductase A
MVYADGKQGEKVTMAVLFSWPEGDPEFWRRTMEETLGPIDFRVYPEVGDRGDIEYALVWRHPEGDLASYPNLKAIFSPNQRRRVAVLGLGQIGAVTAQALAALGFPVTGWSRSPKSLEGIDCRAGIAALDEVLSGADILVNILPGTAALTDLLDYERLRRLPEGAFVINLGRGEAIVDADLIRLLDENRIAGAALDVFRVEPLAEDDPYWSHPRVHVTPHAAGPSTNDWAPRHVAENIRRIESGEAPRPVVDRRRGY